MTVHIHITILTNPGLAANNRGLTEGNLTTLQKITCEDGSEYTFISSPAIKHSLRNILEEWYPNSCNRTYNKEKNCCEWRDPDFIKNFLDNNLFGYMTVVKSKKGKATIDSEETSSQGKTKFRKALVECSNAISITPYSGDVQHHFASVGATLGTMNGKENCAPYSVEVHYTAYQYSFSISVNENYVKETEKLLKVLPMLNKFGGNHTNYFCDYSVHSMLIRVTYYPDSRIINCFTCENENLKNIKLQDNFVKQCKYKNIKTNELIFSGIFAEDIPVDLKNTVFNDSVFIPNFENAIDYTIKQMHKLLGEKKQ